MGGTGSGRKAKPPELHKLHGNPGRRPLPENSGLEDFGTTTCPAWLDKTGKNEWRRLAPTLERLGILHAGNRTAFAGYCHAYSLAVNAAHQFKTKRDAQMTFWNGKVDRTAPEVEIQLKALEAMRRLMSEFGLTPATAGKVPTIGKVDLSDHEDFLFGQGEKRRPEPTNDDPKVAVGKFGAPKK
jgi:P27 family predicted phage terminase small subunit